MKFRDLFKAPTTVAFERRGVKTAGKIANSLSQHPDVEVTVACLDAQFRIDCIQYVPSVGNTPARIHIRIEPDGEV